MTEKIRKWIVAAIELGKKTTENFFCPNCQDANLNVKDIFVDLSQSNLEGERHLMCPKCNKTDSLLFKQFKENFGVDIDKN